MPLQEWRVREENGVSWLLESFDKQIQPSALARSLLAVSSPPDFDTNNQIENQVGKQKRKHTRARAHTHTHTHTHRRGGKGEVST